MDLSNLSKQVEKIVSEVGEFALKAQPHAIRQVEKEKGDYATNVDLEAERMIVEGLGNLEGGYPVFAEEAHIQPDKDIYWVVDPIDGTKNYFRGVALWSVNVGLYDSKNDEVLLGVVYFPKLGDLFSAYKSGGVRLNGEKISPSNVNDLSEAIIHAELPNSTRSIDNLDKFNSLVKQSYRVRGWGVAAALCYTANGAFDAHVDLSGTTKPYDIYPSLVIAKEAGCRIHKGDRSNFIVVDNGKLALSLT